ncbi:MAG: DUF4126 family protein [Actinobacteria bacterium]|nr:DUF4126 family protein [Actinomycetota bacterium]
MEAAWAVGAGAGLASLAGFRAIIPLAIYVIMARLGWVWGFQVDDNPLDFMISNAALVVVLALIVLDILMTRVKALTVIGKNLQLALSVAVGALLMSAAIAGTWPGAVHFVGIPIGAALALAGVYDRRGMVMVGEGRDPGPALDASVLIISILMMLVPPAGYLVVLLTLFLATRVRRMRRLKYKGLRVLA